MAERIDIPCGPYYLAVDEGEDTIHDKHSGLAMIDTGRTEDWPIARLMEWPTARYVHRAISEYDALKKRITVLESERDRLRKFVEFVLITEAWDADYEEYIEPGQMELDGVDLQEKAENLGLIEKRPAPQSFRDEWGSDEWYQFVWTPAEAVKEVDNGGKN